MFVENGTKEIAFEKPFEGGNMSDWVGNFYCHLNARYPEGSDSGRHRIQLKDRVRPEIISN